MASENYDVVVVGSCNVDLISYVPRFPRAGETLTGHKFAIGCGGKGANACVMAAKLGAKASMIGRVGDDSFGEMYLKNFSKHGINIDHLKVTKDTTTGVAPIHVNDDGENAIVIVKGANDLITKEDLRNAMSVIRNAKVVLCQLEIDADITLETLKIAKQNHVTTIFNPAPAIKGLSKEFLQNSDIVICNETEAEILTGLPVTNDEQLKKAIKGLLKSGCCKVVITLGSRGAICAESSQEEPTFISAKQVKAVDTTGAGDAFVGTLAYFHATRGDSLPFVQIVERACHIAGVTVTKPGTQSSYPNKNELPDELFQ
ncbi:ribokinase-like [Rhopilema esculentum]|uniref:ribokinase-like n=1 Tax=Rhopilema esculentum TaxID=499914 RepID=UPI0031D78396|eukprot:gene3470-1851_t